MGVGPPDGPGGAARGGVRGLDQFLSTFTNRIDKKGRVSVPADWRAVLAARQSVGVLLFPAVYEPAIQGAGQDYLAELDRDIDALPRGSAERDDLIYTLKPSIRAFQWDSEGRLVLNDDLIAYAKLDEVATFVGLGQWFQIWRPEAWTAREAEAKQRGRAPRARPAT